MSVRDAGPDDAPAVASLLGELGYPSSAEQAAVRLGRLIEDAAARVWLADEDGEPAGLVAMRWFCVLERDEPLARLLDIVVRPESRGRGLGARLVRRVVDEARARGCYRVEVMSGPGREAAHSFYLAHGFQARPRRFVMPL